MHQYTIVFVIIEKESFFMIWAWDWYHFSKMVPSLQETSNEVDLSTWIKLKPSESVRLTAGRWFEKKWVKHNCFRVRDENWNTRSRYQLCSLGSFGASVSTSGKIKKEKRKKAERRTDWVIRRSMEENSHLVIIQNVFLLYGDNTL